MKAAKVYAVVLHKKSGKVWTNYVVGKVNALEYIRDELRSKGVGSITISEVQE